MSKRTKTVETTTDQKPAPPSIEERVGDATKRYLADVEHLMSPELGKPKMYWSTTTPALVSRPVPMDLDRALRPRVKVAPRPPHDPPPETTPRARTHEEVDRDYRS
jgi:hypothetical protein